MAWNKYLKIEVPLFLCIFCAILEGTVISNLNIYRTCYVVLGFDESDCAQLGREENDMTKELEKRVQQTTNKIDIANNVLSALTLIYSMYVGIWSDKFGRKPFLLLCLAGTFAHSLICTIFTFFHNVSPWWFLTCQIPMIFTGNFITLFILMSTYLSDVTTSKDRMIRFAIFQVILTTGRVLAGFVTPIMVYGTSYEMIYCLVSTLQLAAFLYTLFVIPESLCERKEEFKFRKLLKHINFLEIARSALKKRPNSGRLLILASLGIIILTGFTQGAEVVRTLFLRAKLQWTLTEISWMASITSVCSVIATTIGTYVLYQKLHIKEIPLATAANIMSAVSYLLFGLATNDYYVYAASAIGIFDGLSFLMIKTFLTFLVTADETGKIIALMDICLNLTTTLANVLYPVIYTLTLNSNPGFYNFVTLGIVMAMTIMLILLGRLHVSYYSPSTTDESQGKEVPKETDVPTEQDNTQDHTM